MRARIESRWLSPAIVILGVVCLFFMAGKFGPPTTAHAQPQTGTENNILLVPVQIGRDTYGLAMVDTIGQTVWIYQLNDRGPEHSRLKLFAARSWRYDRLLRQYNTSEPKPEQVKILLENLEQPQKKQQTSESNIWEIAEPNNNIEGSKSVK